MTFNTKQPIKWNIPADVPADTNQLAFYSIAIVFSAAKAS
jgi:hypothetical protein